MQLNYNEMNPAFAGMLADSGPKDVMSGIGHGAVPFGRGLVRFAGKDFGVRTPKVNSVPFVFSVDLASGDSVIVTVNGNSTAAINYATSHAATMTAIAAAIDALAGVASATVNTRTITIVAEEGVSLSVSGSITHGGSGTATISISHNTTDSVLFAVALASHVVEQGSDGSAQYDDTESVPALRKGRVYVYVEEAVTPDSTVYLRFRNGDDSDQLPGQFRASADSSRAFSCSNARFATSAAADGFAVLEINLP